MSTTEASYNRLDTNDEIEALGDKAQFSDLDSMKKHVSYEISEDNDLSEVVDNRIDCIDAISLANEEITNNPEGIINMNLLGFGAIAALADIYDANGSIDGITTPGSIITQLPNIQPNMKGAVEKLQIIFSTESSQGTIGSYVKNNFSVLLQNCKRVFPTVKKSAAVVPEKVDSTLDIATDSTASSIGDYITAENGAGLSGGLLAGAAAWKMTGGGKLGAIASAAAAFTGNALGQAGSNKMEGGEFWKSFGSNVKGNANTIKKGAMSAGKSISAVWKNSDKTTKIGLVGSAIVGAIALFNFDKIKDTIPTTKTGKWFAGLTTLLGLGSLGVAYADDSETHGEVIASLSHQQANAQNEIIKLLPYSDKNKMPDPSKIKERMKDFETLGPFVMYRASIPEKQKYQLLILSELYANGNLSNRKETAIKILNTINNDLKSEMNERKRKEMFKAALDYENSRTGKTAEIGEIINSAVT